MRLSEHCFALHHQILGIILLVGHHLATRFNQISAFQDATLTFTMRSGETRLSTSETLSIAMLPGGGPVGTKLKKLWVENVINC